MKKYFLLVLFIIILNSCLPWPMENNSIEYIPVTQNFKWETSSSTGMGDSPIYGISTNGSKYIAVGEGKIAISSNGINWNEYTIEKNKWNPGGNNFIVFQGITWADNKFVAVGYWNNRTVNKGVIAVSDSEGENWVIREAPILLSSLPNGSGTLRVDPKLYAITYGSGRFITVGERGYSAWSSDVIEWTPVWILPFSEYGLQEINQDVRAIVYGNEVFLAGGTKGKLAYSFNRGMSWNWVANGLLDSEFNNILTLEYGSGKFIAAGTSGKIKTAGIKQFNNQSNWTTVESGINTDITSIVFGSGNFLAVGLGGRMSLSANGNKWNVVPQGNWNNNDHLYSAIYNSRFITGSFSKIIYSDLK